MREYLCYCLMAVHFFLGAIFDESAKKDDEVFGDSSWWPQPEWGDLTDLENHIFGDICWWQQPFSGAVQEGKVWSALTFYFVFLV